MEIIVPNPNENCSTPDCGRMQSEVIYDRRQNVVRAVCRRCFEDYFSRERPEYCEGCPNCGCGIAIN